MMTFEQLAELKAEPVVRLIETVLPTRGVCLMVGSSKSGKIVLATQLAVAVASGKLLFGFYRVLEPGPVMFIQQDDAAGVESIKQMVSRSPDPKDLIPLFAVDHVPFSFGPECNAWLESQIVRNRPHLVVIDSYTAMRGSRSTGSDVVKSEQSDLALLDEVGNAPVRRS